MRKTTKDDIFTMLVLILSAATSVLIGWGCSKISSQPAVDDLGAYIIPFFIGMIIVFKPWAYLLDYIFRLFEKKKH